MPFNDEKSPGQARCGRSAEKACIHPSIVPPEGSTAVQDVSTRPNQTSSGQGGGCAFARVHFEQITHHAALQVYARHVCAYVHTCLLLWYIPSTWYPLATTVTFRIECQSHPKKKKINCIHQHTPIRSDHGQEMASPGFVPRRRTDWRWEMWTTTTYPTHVV